MELDRVTPMVTSALAAVKMSEDTGCWGAAKCISSIASHCLVYMRPWCGGGLVFVPRTLESTTLHFTVHFRPRQQMEKPDDCMGRGGGYGGC